MHCEYRWHSKLDCTGKLTFDKWSDGISDGRKGDILALHGLCMLFSKHTLVHLHNEIIWSTLDSSSANLLNDLDKFDLHLCYLGRGLFMELVEQVTLLRILENSKENVQTLVIGELSIDEEVTYDSITHTGLGVAVNPLQVDKTTKHTASASAGSEADLPRPAQGSLSPKPSTSSNQMCWELYQMNLRDIKICINKLKMDNLSQHIIVTCKLLEDLPKSKYREEDYLSTLTAAFEAPKIDSYDTDTTIAYSSSDETIPYWSLEDNQQILMLPRSTSQNKT